MGQRHRQGRGRLAWLCCAAATILAAGAVASSAQDFSHRSAAVTTERSALADQADLTPEAIPEREDSPDPERASDRDERPDQDESPAPPQDREHEAEADETAAKTSTPSTTVAPPPTTAPPAPPPTTVAPAPPSTTTTSAPPVPAPTTTAPPPPPPPTDEPEAAEPPATAEDRIVEDEASVIEDEEPPYAEATTFTNDRRAERVLRRQVAFHRLRNGLPHLWSVPSLIDEARRWSHRMATGLGLNHNPDSLRYTYAHCADCVAAAENVGRGPNAEGMLDAFLASPSHRAQIERASRGIIGIGAYRDADDRLYITVMFGFYDR